MIRLESNLKIVEICSKLTNFCVKYIVNIIYVFVPRLGFFFLTFFLSFPDFPDKYFFRYSFWFTTFLSIFVSPSTVSTIHSSIYHLRLSTESSLDVAVGRKSDAPKFKFYGKKKKHFKSTSSSYLQRFQV